MQAFLQKLQHAYQLSNRSTAIISLLPAVSFLIFTLLLYIDASRPLILSSLKENSLIETMTFLVALTAGGYGLNLIFKLKSLATAYRLFYLLFSLLLFLLAMEEIAWGQWLFGFDTPDAWETINAQNETTLHNVAALQGSSDKIRLLYGLGGLLGVTLFWFPLLRPVSASPLLLPTLFIITLHASLDVYNDYFSFGKAADYLMQRLSEFIELLIALSGFMYLWLNNRMLSTSALPISE